jgi:hypothetical protein
LKEKEIDSPKKEKITTKSTPSALPSKVASKPSKAGSHELSHAASSSKSVSSAPDLQGTKHKREATVNSEVQAPLKESVKRKSGLEESNKIGESLVINALHHGFKDSKEVKHPNPGLIVRVSLSSPYVKEPQKSLVCGVKEVTNMNKPTEMSEESATSSVENQNQSTRISSTSLELQEEDSCNVHKPNKGEAVISPEAGEGKQHVTAPEASRGENFTTEETNEDRAAVEVQMN